MQDPFGGASNSKSKAAGLADAINRLLQNLVIKCTKSEGIRDYYYVGVIGYGSNGVGPAFSGSLMGKELVSISDIGNNPMRLEERQKRIDDGAGGIIQQSVKFPVWFEPVGVGETPMFEAFQRANSILVKWLMQHPNCFPPIVINISDGESSDGDPYGPAQDLMTLASADGETLLFNLHLSSKTQLPIEFPESELDLPDEYSKMLFNMSSQLPDYMQKILANEGFSVSPSTHGFVFNADLVSVIRFLDIGTRPANLR